MRAVGYRLAAALGEPAYLVDLELPDPVPEPLDLLVAVEAIAVNPVDLKVRARELPPPDQWRLLGWDAVGRVLAVGDQVRGFQAGERVWYAGALQRPGCNAECQLVDHRLAAHAPRNLEASAAAALPLTSITAWELLFTRLGVPLAPTAGQGETLLVLGGAGGVGSILVQLARQLTGLTVVASASRPQGRAWAEAMGAHHVLDHSQPLQPQLRSLGLPPVSRVASLSHSGEHFPELVELIAPQGALALIDDPAPEAINVLALKRKSLSLHWEFMFTRSLFGTADLGEQGRLLARVAELVEQSVLRSTMAEQLGPITAATLQRAHHRLAGGQGCGKVVLAGFD